MAAAVKLKLIALTNTYFSRLEMPRLRRTGRVSEQAARTPVKRFLIETPASRGGDGGIFIVTCDSAGRLVTESVEDLSSKEAVKADIAAFGTLSSASVGDDLPPLPRRLPPHNASHALSNSAPSAPRKEG